MSEYEIWAIWQMQGIQIAVSGIAMMFLVWVGFRLAKSVSEAGGGKIPISIALLFNSCVWVGVLANNGFQRFNSQNTASILAEAQSKGLELSSASQGFIAFFGSEVPAFSWTPNIWTGFFLLAIISVVVYTLFFNKTD